MKAGYRGTFVISWMQTELDGLAGESVSAVEVGSNWRWSGTALRVDAPRDVLILDGADGMDELHRRAAANVQRLVGAATGKTGEIPAPDPDGRLFEAGFDVTDGSKRYRVTLIKVDNTKQPLLLFIGDVPPADTDLWVVYAMTEPYLTSVRAGSPAGTICFTPGTRIATPDGPCLVEDLQEGDRVCTRDSGAQQVLWVGNRRITGARLHALPHLRPIRLRANVLGQDEPDADLIVSPDHRILLKGRMSEALFNTDEVLVAAKDLVNDSTITVDHAIRSVTYIHLMLPAHQIVWANGIETESFNPSLAALREIEPVQRRRLFDCLPELEQDPTAYGMPVRRALSQPEAALIRYEMR
ncbi:MAG: Hint domain-containing protein [Paracoccaceae bacterium]